MKTSDFDYSLPPELIAQTPIEPRDHSRLMVLDRRARSIGPRHFFDLPGLLRPGDVLVFNDSRVIPARLEARKAGTGGRIELLLLQRMAPGVWQSLVRPARRVSAGTRLEIVGGPTAEVTDGQEGGIRTLRFSDEGPLDTIGRIPLPPYVHTPLADPARYQTVYARTSGSVAAPTAGLHFTNELIETLKGRDIDCLFVTLHVGLDTFRPVREEDPADHVIHREYGVVSAEVAGAVSRALAESRRVVCVGTTAMRLIEAAAGASRTAAVVPFAGWVDLFIMPGYRFRVAGAMITNFHLPRTTLLMLVSAFAGRDFILEAYQAAIAERYRFYSLGDAMLIV